MGFKIFDEQLLGVEMRKIKRLINKPFYVCFSVLELSTLFLYRFHYDYFMKKSPAVKMLFTDTDSLMYWVETAAIYNELFAEGEHFDFASVDKARPFFDPCNNKVIGKFKHEANGMQSTEFLGLPPKMYSFLIDDKGHSVEKHKEKVIKRGASREMRHQQYLDQLQRPAENYIPYHRIGSTLHKIYTIEVRNQSWPCVNFIQPINSYLIFNHVLFRFDFR